MIIHKNGSLLSHYYVVSNHGSDDSSIKQYIYVVSGDGGIIYVVSDDSGIIYVVSGDSVIIMLFQMTVI